MQRNQFRCSSALLFRPEGSSRIGFAVKLRGGIRAPLIFGFFCIVAIPAAQLLIRNPDSVVWQWIDWGLAGVSLLLFLVFPWLGADWARKLRKELVAEYP